MGAVPNLSDDEVAAGLDALPGWVREGNEIVKRYELNSFRAVIDFVGRIADLAEGS